MAYLDGELATDRAVEAAAHMERCEVCQELAAELRKMSQEMMAWEVETSESDSGLPAEIVEALEKKPRKPKQSGNRESWGILVTPRRLAWAGAFAIAFLIVFGIAIPNRLKPAYQSNQPARVAQEKLQKEEPTKSYQYDAQGQLTNDGKSNGLVNSENASGANNYADGYTSRVKSPEISFSLSDSLRPPPPPPLSSSGYMDIPGKSNAPAVKEEEDEAADRPGVPAVPMIARTAGLTLVAKEFEKTRASLEEILKRHNGYIGELNVSAPSDAGRTLTATLRIPAPQLEAALAELKQLGRVENESQGGEEVTQQYVDLAARLANAQHTEQRLVEMLRSRTGKLQDVLKVELEIDRVRGEIEQMQAEKKELTKRVAFATLNTTIKEEYHAKLEAAPPSTGSRFRNAAVDGYNTVVEGLIGVCLFLLSSGPSLLLWAAILFFPSRWLWRKVRAKLKKKQEQEA